MPFETMALEISVSNLADFAAGVAPEDSIWTSEAGQIALARAEGGLGVMTDEALRHLRQRQPWQPEPISVPFDVERLREHLNLPYSDLRDELMGLLATPEFDFPPEMPRAERREQTLACLHILAEKGIGGLAFPKEFGGAGSPGKSIAAFETLAFGDLSVVVKFGVQFGLFGGSIYQLGTKRHHEKIPAPNDRAGFAGLVCDDRNGPRLQRSRDRDDHPLRRSVGRVRGPHPPRACRKGMDWERRAARPACDRVSPSSMWEMRSTGCMRF